MGPINYIQLCYVLSFIFNLTIVQSITPSTMSSIITTKRASTSTNSVLTMIKTSATSTSATDVTTSTNPKIGVLSMNVTAVNSHFAYIEFTIELLKLIFSCLCGTSYQRRIPLTFSASSNYFYDTGDVEQSSQSSSNEVFICRIYDLNLLLGSIYLNCSRGQPSCDNCGYFNFTSSQCSGQSTQVKWVSTQSVKLGYNPNIVNIACDSSNVQCFYKSDFTITTPTAISGTEFKSSITSTTHVTENAVKTNNTEAPVNIALAVVVACLSLVIVVLLVVLFFVRRRSNLKQQESELRNSVSRIMSSDNAAIQNAQTYSSTEYSSNISTSAYNIPNEVVNSSVPTYSSLDAELMSEENHYLPVTIDPPEVSN